MSSSSDFLLATSATAAAAAGGHHITSRIKVEMHAFWSALIWLADTILFIWMGITLAFVLLEPSDPAVSMLGTEFEHQLTPVDAGYAVVLYLWLLVSYNVLSLSVISATYSQVSPLSDGHREDAGGRFILLS